MDVEAASGRTDDDAPRFSVVVPTFQRRDVVVASVRALRAQRYDKRFEVIVVVDGSTDGSATALRSLETPFPLTVLEQPNAGQASARNRGAAQARGDILLFLDDDMEADPELLAQHEKSHREGADAVMGHLPLHPESPRTFIAEGVAAWAETRKERILRDGGALELDDLLTGQLSVRRDAFTRLGGFDARYNRGGAFGGEDLDFGRRLLDSGYRVVFNPDAISRQRYVVTPRQYLRQWRQTGRSTVMLARAHPSHEIRFRWHETTVGRLVGRPLRVPWREAVLALARFRPTDPRVGRWFFLRVRKLEYLRGVRDAGGEPAGRPVRVLCYHSIADLAGAPRLERYGIPPKSFRRQLELLARHFRFLSADEFARYLEGGGVPRRSILLTFDDCYEDLLQAAAPILREMQIPALAFAVTGRLGGTNDWDIRIGAPELRLLDAAGLRALSESNVAIGSHTRTHRMLDRIPADELKNELEGSIDDLGSLGLEPPLFLSYPHGLHGPDVRTAARTAGFVGAFTVDPGLARPDGDRYAIPRIEVLRDDAGWRFAWKVLVAGRRRRSASG